MLFSFLQKQTDSQKKKKLIETMILSLNIPETQKELYVSALSILSEEEKNILYRNLTSFVQEIEMKELEEIHSENFSSIGWLRKKEAVEKTQEMNSFSFLLHNI